MNIKKTPLISIITVSYNAASSIEQTILSVINQSFEDYEYIIVDGGSTDGTVGVIKKHQDKITLWVSEPDKGIYDAMNKGTEMASGEYLIYINAGDQILDFNFNFLKSTKNKDVFYGNILSENNKVIVPYDLKTIGYAMPFCHQAVIVNTQLMKEYRFNSNYKIAADFDLFQRLVKDRKEFHYENTTMALFEGGGVSSEMDRLYVKEYLSVIFKNKINYYWPFFLIKFTIILLVSNFKKR
jgi:glycosyltransferase involved in cell wall biosynthesis